MDFWGGYPRSSPPYESLPHVLPIHVKLGLMEYTIKRINDSVISYSGLNHYYSIIMISLHVGSPQGIV